MARVEGREFPADRWYDAREHVWVAPAPAEGGWVLTVGLDALAGEALGDVVYVELVEPGRPLRRGEALGSVEAEKMVRPLLAPVAGVLVEVNRAVLEAPGLVGADPYGEGWLCRILADGWERDREGLLHGDPAVTAWVRAELAAHEGAR